MKNKSTLLTLLATSSLAVAQISTSSFSSKVGFTTGNKPYGIEVADFDKDGKNDMAVTNFDDNTVSVFLNQGTSGTITTSTFASRVNFTTGKQPSHLTSGDIDGDGSLDLIVSNEGGTSISVLRNTSTAGNISFAAKIDFSVGSGSPNSVFAVDIDKDGHLDLACSVYTGNKICVFRNTSTSGNITTDTRVDLIPNGGVSVRGMDAGDINGDGKLDLVCFDDFNSKMYVYQNNASSGSITSGSFSGETAFTTSTKPYAIEVADIDNDGKEDILLNSNDGSKMSVYINQVGTGTISSSFFGSSVDFTTPASPYYGLSADDLDDDGDLDVSTASIGGSAVSVFENTGSGTFGTGSLNPKVDFATASITTMSAVGDVDGDGMLDLLANGVTGNKVYVYRNLITPTGIANVNFENSIKAYPNPAIETINIQFSGSNTSAIFIYNYSGEIIYTNKLTSSINSITVKEFSNGVYFIKIIDEISGKNYTGKFIKN